jgi:DNA-binding XRE family transcriptional regulator
MINEIHTADKITLKEIRQQTRLTQKEFSAFVEIPLTTYRKYENNISKMEVGQLFHICCKVGVPIEKIKV